MATEFHLRVQQMLEEALRVPPEQRSALIEQACSQDASLLREVRSLLPHYEQTCRYEPGREPEWFLPGTTTMRRAQAEAAEVGDEDPEPPFHVGEYRCDEVIGRGGMGTVYRAQHMSQRGTFALKLLQRESLSSESRWRFAFEAELLRRLQHPGLARILAASEVHTAHGTRPYLVMEYIRGESLIHYAEERKLNVLQRLKLLARVCEPIEYAHHRGIIHRDLKPANILVDRTGRPRILDFGVARVEQLDPLPADEEPGGFIGTLRYASPEQKLGRNDELTPACDVYALGLIAHQLLTGRLPQIVQLKLRLDLNRIGLEDRPRASAARQEEFRYLMHVIFSGALAESPAKRYRSAGKLAAAINAVLAEFDKPTRWAAWRSRLSRLLAPEASSSSEEQTRGPLSAVLRARIAMSMEADRTRPSGDSSAGPTTPDSDDETYRVRDPEL